MAAMGLTRRARGFTLIEAMIALAILAIGLLGTITAMVAAARLDRRFNSRAAAHAVAMELARTIERWDFSDPRLALVHNHAGAAFSEPAVTSFSVTPGSPPAIVETLSAPADHDESECGPCGRDLAVANTREPGSTYLFRRYWNVIEDPSNPHLKLVAVHVTYSRSATDRGVASAYTSVYDAAALLRSVLKDRF